MPIQTNALTGPVFFKPACLPPALLDKYETMTNTANGLAAIEACVEIIKEYHSCFDSRDVQQDMWLLLCGTMCNDDIDELRNADNRRNLLFFYEFTLMLLDAVYLLHGYGRQVKKKE